MRQQIINAIMVIAALFLSMQTYAKGPPNRPVVLTDANGVKIGRVIGMEKVSWPYVLTDNGYRTLMTLATSAQGGLVHLTSEGVYYEDLNCENNVAYQYRARFLGSVFSPTSQFDIVYAAGGLLYSPSDAELATVDINSMLRDSNIGCEPYIEEGFQGYPAYPNDPNITGIENTAYPARLITQ